MWRDYFDGDVDGRTRGSDGIADPTETMAMVTLADFSRIVSAVHAAAITPAHWIAAMEAIRSSFGSTSAALITADGASRVINSAYLPEDAERTYSEHYHRVDYVLDAVEHGPVGLIRSGEPLVALNARSEFNADLAASARDAGRLVRPPHRWTPAHLLPRRGVEGIRTVRDTRTRARGRRPRTPPAAGAALEATPRRSGARGG